MSGASRASRACGAWRRRIARCAWAFVAVGAGACGGDGTNGAAATPDPAGASGGRGSASGEAVVATVDLCGGVDRYVAPSENTPGALALSGQSWAIVTGGRIENDELLVLHAHVCVRANVDADDAIHDGEARLAREADGGSSEPTSGGTPSTGSSSDAPSPPAPPSAPSAAPATSAPAPPPSGRASGDAVPTPAPPDDAEPPAVTDAAAAANSDAASNDAGSDAVGAQTPPLIGLGDGGITLTL